MKKITNAHYSAVKRYTAEVIAFCNLAKERDVTLRLSKLELWSLQEYGFASRQLKRILKLLESSGSIVIDDDHIIPKELYNGEIA